MMKKYREDEGEENGDEEMLAKCEKSATKQ